MRKINSSLGLSKFKPETCVFVISVDKQGKPSGMIAGWSMRCSTNPPLYAVALSKKHYTHKLIQQSKEFVVAVPNKKLEKDVIFFGTTHGNQVDKFKETKIKIEKAKFVKSPLLKDATLNFECKLLKEVDAGDHVIFVGKVLAAYINEDNGILVNFGMKNGNWVFKELKRVA